MLNRLTFRFSVVLFVCASCAAVAGAQTRKKPSARPPSPMLHVRSNLVVVSALVTTNSGQIVFSLTADDFRLTDNGIAQKLKLIPNTDSEPLALAVVVEAGADGAPHLPDYRGLGPVLAAVVGGVPHRIAVIAFAGSPRLVLNFTKDTDAAARAVTGIRPWGSGAAILDALNFAMDLLRRQPPAYRRAVLLLSETADGGSQTNLANVLRKVDDTDTEIYAFAFSSTKAAIARQVAEQNVPYGPGGCMAKGSDPKAHGSRIRQLLDCATDLLPPLHFGQLALLAVRGEVSRNVPKTVAQLTGGEYFPLKNKKAFRRDLLSISNEIPNYYVLTFRPQSPAPGFHALKLSVKDRPGLRVKAPSTFWVAADTADIAAQEN